MSATLSPEWRSPRLAAERDASRSAPCTGRFGRDRWTTVSRAGGAATVRSPVFSSGAALAAGAVPGVSGEGLLAVPVGAVLGAGVAGSAAGLAAAPEGGAGGEGGGLGGALGKLIEGGSVVLTAPDGLIGACAEAVAASDNIAAEATPPHRCFMPHLRRGEAGSDDRPAAFETTP
jgi:hypothetical protein